MRRFFFNLLVIVGLSGTAVADTQKASHEIAVISNGWHTAIVAPREPLVATGLIPELADFPDATFIEFGWGDRTYYPSDEKSVGEAIGAAIGGSPAVIHLNGLSVPATKAYANAEVVTLKLSDEQLSKLSSAIDGYFQRDDGKRAKAVQPGLYRNSLFYNAHGEFHLFNTCNTWTARILQATGIPVSPDGVFRASTLIERLRGTKPAAKSQRNER